ncbi:hypothetical protein [Microbulbifer sp. SSSA005]|uniref:hypothetical protein n=1 Tax=Microbulbifer sp. SSSA005 TaxID=3243378 RepID=UPI0040391337
MKRPTWATVVGVLAIIFGILGVLAGVQEIAIPSMIEMQKEMMTSFSEGKTPDGKSVPEMSWEIKKDGEKQKTDMSQMFEGIEEQFEHPEWYKSWAAVLGLISLVVAALYLLSGILLLMAKQFSIRIFYVAIGVSVIWAIVQAIIYSQADSSMLMAAQIPSSISSVVIDIILLVVVFIGSKEAFSTEQAEI